MKHTLHSKISALLLCLLLCITMLVSAVPESGSLSMDRGDNAETATAETPKTDAQGRPILGTGETGILIEQHTGNVLLDRDSKKRMFPASTTKVMTALLTIEAMHRGEFTEDTGFTVREEMIAGLDPLSSSMDLVADEELTVKQLLQGLMVPSANDAAMALSYLVAGGEQAFVDRMNERARELGLNDTHFVNPHGLHDPEHYTTAADMAVIAKEAMRLPEFRNLADIVHIKIPPTNKTEKERYYISTNGLLSAMRYTDFVYKGATGIKTGHTSEAGFCLVSSASKNGMDLIGVVFGGKAEKDSHGDSARMLNYGFEHYTTVTAVHKGDILSEAPVRWGKSKDSVTLAAAEDVTIVVPKGAEKETPDIRTEAPEKLYAPIEEGQLVATVSVWRDNIKVGEGSLAAIAPVERSFFWPILALGEWLWSFRIIRAICYILLAFLVVFIFFLLRNLRKASKERKRKQRRERLRKK